MHFRLAAPRTSTKYRPDIDGLRSLAVLPVVLFHAGASIFPGGFIGVDVFFVISGYLISGILLADYEQGRFSLIDFYERRVRRILPALTLTLVLTFVCAWLFFLPSYFVDFSKSLVATVTFLSNMYFWKYSGYFDNSAQLRPLLHTWSLAVEEQFYILMPLAIYVVCRFARRFAAAFFVLVAVGSLALSIYLTDKAPTANFFILPTRAWELLFGAVLAISRPAPIPSRLVNDGIGVLSIVLIAVPVFLYSEATPFPGLAAVPPCMGAALLIYTGARPDSLAGRLLALSPLVFVGKISYSLYLLHWPVAVFFRYLTLREPDLPTIAAILALSFALAVLSWWLIERPFRDRGFITSRRLLFLLALLPLVATALVGGAGIAFKGWPQRFPQFHETVSAGGNSWNNGDCFLEGDLPPRFWHEDKCAITHGGPEKVLLWGDSFAAHYAPGIAANAAQIPYTVVQYNEAGCPPALSYYSYARPNCTAFNRNALDIIKRLDIHKVVLSARWTDLQGRGLDQIASTLEALGQLGVEAYVIGQSPIFITDVDVIAFLKSDGKSAVDTWPMSIDNSINDRLRVLTGGHNFIDPVAALCTAQGCPYRRDGKMLFNDFGHLSDAGSAAAVAAYFPYMSR